MVKNVLTDLRDNILVNHGIDPTKVVFDPKKGLQCSGEIKGEILYGMYLIKDSAGLKLKDMAVAMGLTEGETNALPTVADKYRVKHGLVPWPGQKSKSVHPENFSQNTTAKPAAQYVPTPTVSVEVSDFIGNMKKSLEKVTKLDQAYQLLKGIEGTETAQTAIMAIMIAAGVPAPTVAPVIEDVVTEPAK